MTYEVLGHLQLRIMKRLWEVGTPQTVHDVHTFINGATPGKQLAYTTILTVMRNLARRGIVSQRRNPSGRCHDFTTLVSRGKYESDAVKDILDGAFDGDKARLVAKIWDVPAKEMA